MSSNSDLVSVVSSLQFANYLAVAVTTAVVYDYVITLAKEIDYVWNRPWTFVSVMFIIVRYVGLFVAIWVNVLTWTSPGVAIRIASDYAFTIFLAAADIVMMLRLYAMYNRSKIVLGLLLVLYIATIILYTTSSVYYNNPNTVLSVTNSQVLGMSFCDIAYNIGSDIGAYKLIPRITLALLMFVLAVALFCKESYQMYRETRTWDTNRYVRLLVRESILYFFVHVLNMIGYKVINSAAIAIVDIIFFVAMIVLSSRFIVSVRELYVRNLLRVSVHCSGIDSGFGFSESPPTRISTGPSAGIVRSSGTHEEFENIEMQAVGRDTCT